MCCGGCGQALDEGARFCGRCGRPAAGTAPGTAPAAGLADSPPTPDPWGPPPVPVMLSKAPVPSPSPSPSARGARRTAPLLLAVAASLLVAALAGFLVHLVPQSGSSPVSGVGRLDATTVSTASGADASPSGGAASGSGPAADAAGVQLRTSCGKVLDVVPTRAEAHREALRVSLELRPVCEKGEWISSSALRLRLTDTAGVPFADGTFDFSRRRLYVPGLGDETTHLTADFGLGSAWVAPDSLSSDIAAGSVLVGCTSTGGRATTPADAPPSSSTVVAAATPSSGAGPAVARTALQALRRQAVRDDDAVSALEGSWIPQLSSKRSGTYDALDGRTYSLVDIYRQFLALRLRYPNVRLLSSSDWNSYERAGYWVVVAGVPSVDPESANQWCTDRGIPSSQCYAKRLIRDGAPEGNTQLRR